VEEFSPSASAPGCGPAIPVQARDAGEAELVEALLRRDCKASKVFISRYSDAVYSYLAAGFCPTRT
jgi:hypothetical protein